MGSSWDDVHWAADYLRERVDSIRSRRDEQRADAAYIYEASKSSFSAINDITYNSIAAAAAYLKGMPGSEEINSKRFKSRGVVYEIGEGENPRVLKKKYEEERAAKQSSYRSSSSTFSSSYKSKTQAAPMSAEKQYDLIHNEGAEGYNPHRVGDRPTYWRNRR